MKNFKPCKVFAVIAVIFCIKAAACGVFAAETYNYDGSTEVVARVESTTAPAQATDGQVSAADNAAKATDSSSVKTGRVAALALTLALVGSASLALLIWGLRQKE